MRRFPSEIYAPNLQGKNTGDETTATIGTTINGSSAKATPVDADLIPVADSVSSFAIVKTTWAQIKAALKAYFDTVYAALSGSSTQDFSAQNLSVSSINSGQIAGQNIVMNGDMRIDQLNEGAAITPTLSGTYVVDRFFLALTQASKITAQRVIDAPAGTGLVYSLKLTVASQFSPGVADVSTVRHFIEGSKSAQLGFGTASAKPCVIFFWAKASVAGNYSVAIRNAAGNRSYLGTVALTSSWAQVSVALTADTTGTWPTDNTRGLVLDIDLGSGSNFASTAGSWQASLLIGVTGNVIFQNQANGSTLNITGVGTVPGSVAPTVYPVIPYEQELARCQRYVEKSFPKGTAPAQNAGLTGAHVFTASKAGAVANLSPTFGFGGQMNATPTMTYYNPSAANAFVRDVTAGADCTATATNRSGDSGFSITATPTAAGAVGNELAFHWLAVAQL